MIPRYARKEMVAIWSDENRFRIWLEVETLALEGMVRAGLAPQEALDAVRGKGRFDTARVLEIEQEVKHDVIAFLTNVAEYVGPLSRYVHRGLTSSDLLDTSFAVQLKQSADLILQDMGALLAAIREQALKHKNTPCIGRTHGIHAEPTTFGLKLLSWYAEIKRQEEQVRRARESSLVGKMAGAVGTYHSTPPEVEEHVMRALGLEPETVPTQIVARDRHAAFFSSLALLASSIERIAIEIRHLQRTEVREVEEQFTAGQKGSSAMPHKRNPILAENITGLARLVRGYALPAMENVALWHERDISHSSVERVIAPDACILTDFMLQRLTGIVKHMVVHADRMKENLEASRGLIFSGSLLVSLTEHGVVREEAYRLVQKHAMAAWEGGPDFYQRVSADPEIMKVLGQEELRAIFDLSRHFQAVDRIFERTLRE